MYNRGSEFNGDGPNPELTAAASLMVTGRDRDRRGPTTLNRPLLNNVSPVIFASPLRVVYDCHPATRQEMHLGQRSTSPLQNLDVYLFTTRFDWCPDFFPVAPSFQRSGLV
jgi:hypothetical protein